MKRSERIFGWFYLPIHAVLLNYVITFLYAYFNEKNGLTLDTAHLNLIYYAISFTFVLIFMFRFLRLSFSDLCDNLGKSVVGVIIGYVAYYALSYLVILVLSRFLTDLINPNSNLISEELQLNPNVMKAVGILLAPVVEETLFRGVVFGTIRKKSRIFAYIVSVVLFAVYHLWSYMLGGFDWTMLLYLLQYIPGGLVLAWCYEQSRNIWAPIFLHMLINFVALSVQLLM